MKTGSKNKKGNLEKKKEDLIQGEQTTEDQSERKKRKEKKKMSARNDDSLLFIVEWYDPLPQLKKQYLLKYYTTQNNVEMVDIKSKKMFLKKSPCPDTITPEDFYIGSKILLYSRELDIIDYGDLKTKERLSYQIQTVLIALSNQIYQYWGQIIEELLLTNLTKLTLIHMKTFYWNASQVNKVITVLDKNIDRSLLSYYQENVTLSFVLNGENAFQVIQTIINKCKNALNLQNDENCVLFTVNGMQSSSLVSYLFTDPSTASTFPSTVTLDNSTCVIIKPHAVKARTTGAIINHIITQGYEISAIKSLLFDKIQAEEFLEVYKGVIPEYTDHTIQLSSGLSIALEIRAQNAVETFRQTAGPWDVDMAKELRPDTIRALYGMNRILNAIHCTDLPEDAELECEYCFKLL